MLVVFVGTNTSDKTAIRKLDKAIASSLLGGSFLFLIVWAAINRVHYFRLRSKKRGMSGQTEKAYAIVDFHVPDSSKEREDGST